jgi:hypothetical protein
MEWNFAVVIPFKEERFLNLCAEVGTLPCKATHVRGSPKTPIVKFVAFKRYEFCFNS